MLNEQFTWLTPFSQLESSELTWRTGATEKTMVVDPVCHMTIDESKAAGKSEYNGKTYYFCAVSCKTKFDQDPKKYVN